MIATRAKAGSTPPTPEDFARNYAAPFNDFELGKAPQVPEWLPGHKLPCFAHPHQGYRPLIEEGKEGEIEMCRVQGGDPCVDPILAAEMAERLQILEYYPIACQAVIDATTYALQGEVDAEAAERMALAGIHADIMEPLPPWILIPMGIAAAGVGFAIGYAVGAR